MKLVQINVTANWGSTGKIAEDIGKLAIEDGWESWIAYGRGTPQSSSQLIRIGSNLDMKLHALQTRVLDNHGLASKDATLKFIRQIDEIKPDIVHLHNIHGYYLNYPILFDWLKKWGGPVVWTLHDCWPFTGHCAYYDYAKCLKWQTHCEQCPQLRSYPSSKLLDRSFKNFDKKIEAFSNLSNLTFVPVSDWLREELAKSFLGKYPAVTIHNGIDISTFHPIKVEQKSDSSKIVLGVASVWDRRKGLSEFEKIRRILPSEYVIILVGLSQDQISNLPDGITGIRRTENVEQLVSLYNMADVFANPTLEDNFPTTNLEALACGTPVVTYNTGGSPEAIDCNTGRIVEYQNSEKFAHEIVSLCRFQKPSEECRMRAEKLYDKNIIFKEYISLYNSLV